MAQSRSTWYNRAKLDFIKLSLIISLVCPSSSTAPQRNACRSAANSYAVAGGPHGGVYAGQGAAVLSRTIRASKLAELTRIP